MPGCLCLDSLGGDFQGALRLGAIIRSFQMDTCVESQYFKPRVSNHTTPIFERRSLSGVYGKCAVLGDYYFAPQRRRLYRDASCHPVRGGS